MATRDENLKKINDELEKLDDEQLEKVAGGFCSILSVDDINANKIAENSQGGIAQSKEYSSVQSKEYSCARFI